MWTLDYTVRFGSVFEEHQVTGDEKSIRWMFDLLYDIETVRRIELRKPSGHGMRLCRLPMTTLWEPVVVF